MTPLEKYAVKYNYTILKQYSTFGESRNHSRAQVRHNETGEIHYLYFDASPKYRRNCLTCKHHRTKHGFFDCNVLNCICPIFENRVARGWRNTTLDNRRRHDKNVSTKKTD